MGSIINPVTIGKSIFTNGLTSLISFKCSSPDKLFICTLNDLLSVSSKTSWAHPLLCNEAKLSNNELECTHYLNSMGTIVGIHRSIRKEN
ncbi:Uncharacterized protein APZ42_001741 [Daphnia magna]|uniref:Uncharacterized protein n=1 Tax=Daphnia magna TaxID=35525 RepID=A0A164IS38_9CRUS|nr:Uncharacterized protein APZ42_001741 [Daphnia magna]